MSVEKTETKLDHECIWLEPRPPADIHEDRSWCQDDVWTGDPNYEGELPTKYIRVDLVAAKDAEIERLRARIQDISLFPESER